MGTLQVRGHRWALFLSIGPKCDEQNIHFRYTYTSPFLTGVVRMERGHSQLSIGAILIKNGDGQRRQRRRFWSGFHSYLKSSRQALRNRAETCFCGLGPNRTPSKPDNLIHPHHAIFYGDRTDRQCRVSPIDRCQARQKRRRIDQYNTSCLTSFFCFLHLVPRVARVSENIIH